ncbi:unnamed protein product [Pieris macdunnoughi]|uniref:G-protein coupled receptors family 1 profile domain-containing protein n=1 Tax=Pieris macdunnoughi TaxID=345717 RepID=A0A821Y3C5_9NEOP|nr:unnamed protein product [Pieris macdunnoughi]
MGHQDWLCDRAILAQTNPIVNIDIGSAFGILVNLVAFVFIIFGNKVKSAKQKLLLTILTLNNAAALIALLCAQLLYQLSPSASKSRYYCALYVVGRMFGINGGCTDVVIAIDRFFAIRNPILYFHRITTSTIRKLLGTILLLASLFTLAPVMGLGAYYNAEKESCISFNGATNDLDYAYGIAFVIFGFSICITLVLCNIGVVTTLSKYTLSKKSMKSDEKQEVVFSKLIVAISIIFIICWLPHLITDALYLALEDITSKSLWNFKKFANLLILLNFILSPIIQMFMLK